MRSVTVVHLYDPPPCCVYVYMHFTYDEFVETLLSGRIALLAKIGRRKAALFRFLSVECEPAVRRHCKMSKLHVRSVCKTESADALCDVT